MLRITSPHFPELGDAPAFPSRTRPGFPELGHGGFLDLGDGKHFLAFGWRSGFTAAITVASMMSGFSR
jgi:hypothetical protein